MTPPARRSYTAEDKRRGLIALLATGNVTAAAKEVGIPRKTLETWRNTESELYANLSREYGPQIDASITAQLTEAIQSYGEIERKLVSRLDQNTSKIDPRDIPAALKNVQAAQAQAIDKRQLLTGQATERVEHLDVRDLLAEIHQIIEPHRPKHIDSTAVETT